MESGVEGPGGRRESASQLLVKYPNGRLALWDCRGREYRGEGIAAWRWLGPALLMALVSVPGPARSDPRPQASDLLRVLYPGFQKSTGLIGPGYERGRDLYATGEWLRERRRGVDRAALGAEIRSTRSHEGQLLVMVETYTPGEAGFGVSAYGVDLALFAMKDKKAVLSARLYDAVEYGGHSTVEFDERSYHLSDRVQAIGIIEKWEHMGSGRDTLWMFVRKGARFAVVFKRPINEKSDYADSVTDGPISPEEVKRRYSKWPGPSFCPASAEIGVPHLPEM